MLLTIGGVLLSAMVVGLFFGSPSQLFVKFKKHFFSPEIDLSKATSTSSNVGVMSFSFPEPGKRATTRRLAICQLSEGEFSDRFAAELRDALSASGEFDSVELYATGEEPKEGSLSPGRWIYLAINDDLASLFNVKTQPDGSVQSNLSVAISYSLTPSNFIPGHGHDRFAPPFLPTTSREFSGQGYMTFGFPERIRVELLEHPKFREKLSDQLLPKVRDSLLDTIRQQRSDNGELPELPASFFPKYVPAELPESLRSYPSKRLRATHSVLTPTDLLWILEIPTSESLKILESFQDELTSNGYSPFKSRDRVIEWDNLQVCPDYCQAKDDNSIWEIQLTPDVRRLQPNTNELKERIDEPVTRLLIHFVRYFPKSEVQELIRSFCISESENEIPAVDTLLMFEGILSEIDPEWFELQLKEGRNETNALSVDYFLLKAEAQHLSVDEFQRQWAQLYLTSLKLPRQSPFEVSLEGLLTGRRVDFLETLTAHEQEINNAGIPILENDSKQTIPVRIGERAVFFYRLRDKLVPFSLTINELGPRADSIHVHYSMSSNTFHNLETNIKKHTQQNPDYELQAIIHPGAPTDVEVLFGSPGSGIGNR